MDDVNDFAQVVLVVSGGLTIAIAVRVVAGRLAIPTAGLLLVDPDSERGERLDEGDRRGPRAVIDRGAGPVEDHRPHDAAPGSSRGEAGPEGSGVRDHAPDAARTLRHAGEAAMKAGANYGVGRPIRSPSG